MESAADFIAQSREYLSRHYLPKISAAVEPLTVDQIWWRPNGASNSIGNLILHLVGNVGQWLLDGVGGRATPRDRAAEFSRREPMGRDTLLALLSERVQDSDAVLAALEPDALGENRTIQGREVTVLQAVYHVVEHFALHAGQILYIAKLLRGEDLGFYRLVDGTPRASWPGHPSSGSA